MVPVRVPGVLLARRHIAVATSGEHRFSVAVAGELLALASRRLARTQ